jgi:rhamnose utilization protein RhaD (predicted bifunctional aldolase and dehydrogenase)
MGDKQTILHELLSMSREIGRPESNHVILGEGNTSALIDQNTFYVKRSGEQLHTIGEDGFVEIDLARALALLEGEDLQGEARKEALLTTKVDPQAPGRPSVEVLMHAVGLKHGDAKFIGHTHSTVINQLLCSERAESYAHTRLFPDHIVLCGPDSAFVPYVDPGLPLGRAIYQAIVDFKARYNIPPRTIMMKNHGIVVLGQSALDVRQILDMSTKAAEIYVGACAAGGPVAMPPDEVDHIFNREDEHYRRAKLMGAG